MREEIGALTALGITDQAQLHMEVRLGGMGIALGELQVVVVGPAVGFGTFACSRT